MNDAPSAEYDIIGMRKCLETPRNQEQRILCIPVNIPTKVRATTHQQLAQQFRYMLALERLTHCPILYRNAQNSS